MGIEGCRDWCKRGVATAMMELVGVGMYWERDSIMTRIECGSKIQSERGDCVSSS